MAKAETPHVEATTLHMITINLTQEQQAALEQLTGQRLEVLKIGVEDLADIAELLSN